MDNPRFSSKLAEAIDASGRLCATMTEASDMAHAVDRMVKAGDALAKAKLDLMGIGPGPDGCRAWEAMWAAVDEVVRASKEAHAEWWVK